MLNRALHDALREFALEAAAFLTDELRAGAELEFEVTEESPRGGPALYRYRPLTETFIAQRWPGIRSLPACGRAAELLGAGASAFLRVNGLRGEQAEPALQALLERLYEDATSFGFPEERFERVYGDVELTLFEDTVNAALAAPVDGLVLDVDRLELGNGLSIVRAESLDGPTDAAWPAGTAMCVLERVVAPEESLDVSRAAEHFRQLVRGLRLFKAGGVSLGAVAWRRLGDARWSPVEISGDGGGRGEDWVLEAGEEAELRDFLETVGETPVDGTVAWALARFEMGCARRLESEALSDYLLALRALLDAMSDAGRASMALRLAALCAEEGERRAVQRRIEMTLALERFVMGNGRAERAIEASIGAESPRALVAELEANLRALLRDVVCGYLDPDLKSVADDLLLEAPDHLEITARDLRKEADTAELDALVDAPAREPRERVPAPEGVTPSEDWGAFDEDPESWSAPV